MRQFISQSAPDKKGLIEISGKDFRYLRQVLRIKRGDMVSVRLPDGSLVNTTVCQINEEKKKIILQLADGAESITRGVQASEIECQGPLIDYYLFQFIPKPVKMEQIIRQAVECGVKYIVPVIGEYSQKTCVQAMTGAKSDRIERIIREARQQSGSPVETEVLAPLTVSEACNFWKEKTGSNSADKAESLGIVLWERNENTKSLFQLVSENGFEKSAFKKCAIGVGCEGGISPDEVLEMQNAGFVTVHFATNILRCETAALYGIAAVQSALSE